MSISINTPQELKDFAAGVAKHTKLSPNKLIHAIGLSKGYSHASAYFAALEASSQTPPQKNGSAPQALLVVDDVPHALSNEIEKLDAEKEIVVILELVPTVPIDSLTHFDQALSSHYMMILRPGLAKEQYADAALDYFAEHYAGDNLDDFEMLVSLDGEDLESNADHGSYSLGHYITHVYETGLVGGGD